VTAVDLEQFGVVSSARDARRRTSAQRSALDALGGRTVWCASAASGARPASHALAERLAGCETLRASEFELRADGPLHALAEQLYAMLGGVGAAAAPLDGQAVELYAGGSLDGDALMPDGVRRDDVVVFNDPASAMLAEAVRERGAHVVWHVTIARHVGRRVASAWRFVHEPGPAIDAYATRWSDGREAGLVAFMGPADRATGTAMADDPSSGGWDEELGWSRLLADVLAVDRAEHVGGRRHARPAVAAR
jgi:hypothetical protein